MPRNPQGVGHVSHHPRQRGDTPSRSPRKGIREPPRRPTACGTIALPAPAIAYRPTVSPPLRAQPKTISLWRPCRQTKLIPTARTRLPTYHNAKDKR